MKTKYNITAIAATVIACGIASAGTAPAQSASVATDSGIGGYIGVSGVHNEYTADFTDFGGDKGDDDANGFRFNGGLLLGNGFSADGRFESVSGSDQGDDFRITDTRFLFNYTGEVSPGFSLFGGIGYGFINANIEDGLGAEVDIETDGFLLNAGIKYASGPVFGSLVYTHLLAQSAKAAALVDLEEEDLGLLEATVGYSFTEQLAVTLSLDTQVTGDTLIEKDWGVALGLQYDF